MARAVTGQLYVRIVDKGAGLMWGFCAAWVWDTVRKFLIKEGYEQTALTPGDILNTLHGVVAHNGWRENKNTKMCRLYLMVKPKVS